MLFYLYICKNCSNFAANFRKFNPSSLPDVKQKDILYFAFAIYWALKNVGSFRGIPIISQQASILYMGVTYRYMGISYSL